MDPITDLFDRLDAWRHFPNYQLERRADIFFALYLPEVLESTLGIAINPRLAPEFPVRIGTICFDMSSPRAMTPASSPSNDFGPLSSAIRTQSPNASPSPWPSGARSRPAMCRRSMRHKTERSPSDL